MLDTIKGEIKIFTKEVEKAREQWLDNVLDQARKELEDERKG